jgi:hypothetical protein
MSFFRLTLWFGTLLLCAASVNGQSIETRGTIYGRVLDPQGALMPGVAVVVRNSETNVATSLTSNEVGYYQASLLVAGTYSVQAENPGLRSPFAPALCCRSEPAYSWT